MQTNLTLTEKVIAFLFTSDVTAARNYLDEFVTSGVPIEVFKDVTMTSRGLSYIDTPISRLIDTAKEFYRVNRTVLTKDVLIEELKRRRKSADEISVYDALFDKIKTFNLVDQDFLWYCRALREVRDKNDILAAYQESMSHLETGDIKEAYNILRNRVIQIDKRQSTRDRTVSLVSMIDEEKHSYEIVKSNPDALRGIPMGWKEVDEWTFGMHSGELILATARTAVGKSIALGNIAIKNYVAGRNVVVASREMPVNQVRRRFAAAEAVVNYDKLRRGQLDEDEERRYFNCLENRRTKLNQLFIIPQTRCVDTVSIDVEIRKIRDDHPVDLIVVDYLNIIAPVGVTANSRGDDYQGQIALELRDMAIAYEVPVVSAVQDNRSAVTDVEEKGTESIALSDQIGRHADTIFRLYRTPVNKTQGTITLKFIKGREFDAKDFQLRADYQHMLISDIDSSFLGI